MQPARLSTDTELEEPAEADSGSDAEAPSTSFIIPAAPRLNPGAKSSALKHADLGGWSCSQTDMSGHRRRSGTPTRRPTTDK